MHRILIVALLLGMASCKPTSTIYIVRHAEKEPQTTTPDVALSEKGKARAQALLQKLGDKKIQQIYSTNYVRTRSTAEPLSSSIGVPIETYKPGDTSFLPVLLNSINKNTLVVGHSNTVDDLVNFLMRQQAIKSDLPETQYGDLFIIKKKGTQMRLVVSHYGE